MIISLIIAILLIIIDQVSKYLIVSNMALGESKTIIPGLLDFTYTHNDGMALGIGSESFRWVFVVVTLLVCAVLIYLMFRSEFRTKTYYSAVVLIVSGGIGNLIDRVLNGYVVDFLALSFFSPICNFADYCITAGTILLVIFIIFFYGKTSKEESDNNKSESVG